MDWEDQCTELGDGTYDPPAHLGWFGSNNPSSNHDEARQCLLFDHPFVSKFGHACPSCKTLHALVNPECELLAGVAMHPLTKGRRELPTSLSNQKIRMLTDNEASYYIAEAELSSRPEEDPWGMAWGRLREAQGHSFSKILRPKTFRNARCGGACAGRAIR